MVYFHSQSSFLPPFIFHSSASPQTHHLRVRSFEHDRTLTTRHSVCSFPTAVLNDNWGTNDLRTAQSQGVQILCDETPSALCHYLILLPRYRQITAWNCFNCLFRDNDCPDSNPIRSNLLSAFAPSFQGLSGVQWLERRLPRADLPALMAELQN